MPETSQNKENIVRVTVSEAARLFGVNPRTIRRAITAQELRYIVVRGRYKISFPSLVTWSQAQTKVRNKRDEQGIGQWVDHWLIKNLKYTPPQQKKKHDPE
jgi:excisionase family DNA binding protein